MKLLILKEKHGDRYFSFTDDREFSLLARFIVSERFDEGLYEDGGAKTEELLKKATPYDLQTYVTLLWHRAKYEYEGFDIEEAPSIEELTK